MTLLDLPEELIIQILSYLAHQDLISCQLSNNSLYILIKDSVLLQFRIALSTFKATDNPSCPLSVPERFQALKNSEDAWTYLHTDFNQRITVNHEVSGIYDLSGGIFLLGNATRTALHYIKLPSSTEHDVEWQKIQLNHDEGSIIDMGFCLYEHDLLAVVTTKPRPDEILYTTYDIHIIFYKLSTREPHPVAKESTIHVLNSRWARPSVHIEIVGDHLALILTYTNNQMMPYDRIFVYDWRNAVQKMSFSAPHCSYSGLVFLSENLIVIPNSLTNALEIWDVLSSPKSLRPSCILQLPELAIGNSLIYITCRSEPNPIGTGSKFQPNRPFYQSPDEAIMLFHICVQLGDPMTHIAYTYKLFVHRKALRAVYDQQCVEVSRDLGDSSDVPVQVKLEESGTEDDGSWSSEVAIDDIGVDIDVVVRATDDDPIPIPWSSWGPPITRWFHADTNSTRWITTTAGQRCVFLGQSHPEVGLQYVVLDFNPRNIRWAEKKLESSPWGAESRIQCFRNWEVIKTKGVFKDPIASELPFVVCASETFHGWNGALVDEERILGLEEDDNGHTKVIEVHYFGGA